LNPPYRDRQEQSRFTIRGWHLFRTFALNL
jgi:hypothetical protein